MNVSEVEGTSRDHDSRAGIGLAESREDKLLQLMEMMLIGMMRNEKLGGME